MKEANHASLVSLVQGENFPLELLLISPPVLKCSMMKTLFQKVKGIMQSFLCLKWLAVILVVLFCNMSDVKRCDDNILNDCDFT